MRPDPDLEFLARWQALASALQLTPASSEDTGAWLLAQYGGADRHYHGVRHILAMLDGFASLRPAFAHPLAAELAILFHDAIYDPARPDNEARSARAMEQMLAGAVAQAELDRAAFTIEATQHHVATPDPDTNLVVDLDMAILGQPWPVYVRYAAGVMREYGPVHGEDAYRRGRATLFLGPALARGRLFLTHAFAHLDAPAMDNLARERDILLAGEALEG